jgi:hypothetical protein
MFDAVRFRRDVEPMRDARFFVAGLLVGVGLGALLLPRSGGETRRAIRRTAAAGRDRVMDLGEKFRRKRPENDVSDPAEVSGGFQQGGESQPVLAPLENH